MGMHTGLLSGLVALCALVTGCGTDNETQPDNHGFGWHFEVQAANGLVLRNEPGVVEPVSVAVIADIYDQTRACTGLSAPGPFVIVVPGPVDETGRAGGEFLGLTFYQPPLILIAQGPIWVQVAQHEFVHYLLDQAAFPRERNDAHDSAFFVDCVHAAGLPVPG
jgi:hypothetical protein